MNTKNNWKENKNILLHILYLLRASIVSSIINWPSKNMGKCSIKKRIIELSILNKFINFRFLSIPICNQNMSSFLKSFNRFLQKFTDIVHDTFFVSFYSSIDILLSLPFWHKATSVYDNGGTVQSRSNGEKYYIWLSHISMYLRNMIYDDSGLCKWIDKFKIKGRRM